jgi:ketosteroid isomerase-like protein
VLREKRGANDGGDLYMTAVDDVDELIERFHLAQGEFVKGNPEPCKELFSHREDVTLNNPLSPPACGWDEVAATMDRAAAPFRDGEFVSAEIIGKHASAEFSYVVEVERGEAKIGGREDTTPWALRVTMIFRPEDGTWKVVHRHADSITAPQPAGAVIQE